MPSSSPPTGTSVSISATITILGVQVPVNTGDITQLRSGNFNFSLSQPVLLGTIDDFIGWLHNELQIPVTPDEVNGLAHYIPISSLQEAYVKFLQAPITITTLIINTGTKTYAFGATMNFVSGSPPEGINILGLLQFDSIGVLVTSSGITSP
jgi:hypothetical protein